MDTTSIIIIAVAVVAVLGAALFVVSRSWGNSSTRAALLPDPITPPATRPDSDSELDRLLRQGNKIAAIKRVRELTGLGLKDAKDYVESLQTGTPLPEQRASVVPPNDLTSDPELQTSLAHGNKIAAIKRVRELTGLGLKDAKDYVESL